MKPCAPLGRMLIFLTIVSQFYTLCYPRMTGGADYRILLKREFISVAHLRIVDFRISVNEWLGKEDFYKVICEQLKSDHLPDYDMLHVSFYYQLDSYMDPVGHPDLTTKQSKRLVAVYVWNRKLPRNDYALQIYKDRRGKNLSKPEFYRFDHLKCCHEYR